MGPWGLTHALNIHRHKKQRGEKKEMSVFMMVSLETGQTTWGDPSPQGVGYAHGPHLGARGKPSRQLDTVQAPQ